MQKYAKLLQVHLSPKLLKFVQDLCNMIIMDRTSEIVEYDVLVEKVGPTKLDRQSHKRPTGQILP